MSRLFFITILISAYSYSQIFQEKQSYTRSDSLRGSLRKERHFDVQKYDLNLTVEPNEKFIKGVNVIKFVPLEDISTLQIDLFKNMLVDSILYKGEKQNYNREYNAVFINFKKPLKLKHEEEISFYFSGYPIIAKNAPWDGGFVFSKDNKGNPWVATACQGIGASLWWPNKDHQSDEPDRGISMKITVPEELVAVSNGRFRNKKPAKRGYMTWSWEVLSPINNYDVTLNIGDYVHFGENYKGLDIDYYVLRGNEHKAKIHFEEVGIMMDCFQEKFGEYPFKKDGYKLIETPFLGMEHQSAVAYGNAYEKGYRGMDISGTGIGLKWDFIIIHESAHEWFGNSITSSDIADMWIHEGFASYAESVYIEYRWGRKEALDYINGRARSVKNDKPIIGDYGVNKEGSSDMYAKGMLMLNTLRHIVHNDTIWWNTIKKFSINFKYKIISTEDVISFFETETGISLKAIFLQYLKYTHIPVLQLREQGKNLMYRWKVDVERFEMPVEINHKKVIKLISPTTKWKKLRRTLINDVSVDTRKFFISIQKI